MVRAVRKLQDADRQDSRHLTDLAAPDRWTQSPLRQDDTDDQPSFDHFRARWWPGQKMTLADIA
jgi:hypothetical protein